MRVAFIACLLVAVAANTPAKPLVQTVEIDGIPKVNNDHTFEAIPKPQKAQGTLAPTEAPIGNCANPNVRCDQGFMAIKLGFLCMAISAAYFLYCAQAVAIGGRSNEYNAFFVCLIACLAYLCMATDHGIYILPSGREFFYARYIDWALTTPLMLLEICNIAKSTNDTKLWLVGTDFVMIMCGLIGAFSEDDVKYLFWAFGMAMFCPIIYYLLFGLKQNAEAQKSEEVSDLYTKVSYLTVIMWTGYPILWWFCEGDGSFSVDTECLGYVILDVASKCLFGYIIVSSRDALNKQ
jgi:bacteriorhodopsin